jgi:CHAT domain-containing protein
LSLRARLAVLSACETGKGMLQKGEGVMSMARGFGIAGAPSTVMSLWEVDDQISAEIMGAFYQGLAEGKPIDASLRDAKLAHLAKSDTYTASPFYWATYIPVGANAPIQLRLKPARWPYLLAAGITLCAIVLGIFLWKRRKLSA